MMLAPIEATLELDFNTYLCASPTDLEGHPVREHELTKFET